MTSQTTLTAFEMFYINAPDHRLHFANAVLLLQLLTMREEEESLDKDEVKKLLECLRSLEDLLQKRDLIRETEGEVPRITKTQLGELAQQLEPYQHTIEKVHAILRKLIKAENS